MNKIGILGGIGPEATGYFYNKLMHKLRQSGTIKSNVDYPQIIINSINAPELTSLDSITEEQIRPYIKGIQELLLHKPDFIVMACNTIHVFRDKIIDNTNYSNILSIRDIVGSVLIDINEPICVLGTASTIKSNLFHFDQCNYIDLDSLAMAKLGQIVNKYNATGDAELGRSELNKIIIRQSGKGARIFLTACTEISRLLDNVGEYNIVSSLDILIDYVYERSLSKQNR